jgi:hypothetical protein
MSLSKEDVIKNADSVAAVLEAIIQMSNSSIAHTGEMILAGIRAALHVLADATNERIDAATVTERLRLLQMETASIDHAADASLAAKFKD